MFGKSNRGKTSTGTTEPKLVERTVALTDIESELVRAAVAENQTAKQAIDAALAARLAPIRAHHNLKDGTRADFKIGKDGKGMDMVVHEEPEK